MLDYKKLNDTYLKFFHNRTLALFKLRVLRSYGLKRLNNKHTIEVIQKNYSNVKKRQTGGGQNQKHVLRVKFTQSM